MADHLWGTARSPSRLFRLVVCRVEGSAHENRNYFSALPMVAEMVVRSEEVMRPGEIK